MLHAPPFLRVEAWANTSALRRFPPDGTYDVSCYRYIGGVLGLNPEGAHSRGVVIFRWTTDRDGNQIIGPQGIPHTSLIPSLNQLRLPNQGPYLYLTYEPFFGPNPLHVNLFATDVGHPLQEVPGDTILIDEKDQTLAANAAAAIYPADYFAGPACLYLQADPGVVVTLYGTDLTNQDWPIDALTQSGSKAIITPMGCWFIVVSNPTPSAAQYTVAVTPLLNGAVALL